VIHDSMPYDPIQDQGKGHRGPKFAKMANFKFVSSSGMHVLVIKRLTVSYDIPRQYLTFNWTYFWNSPFLATCDFRVFHLYQRILPFVGSTSSHVQGFIKNFKS